MHEIELVDGDLAEDPAEASVAVAVAVLSPPPVAASPTLEERTFFGEAERIAAQGPRRRCTRRIRATRSPPGSRATV